MRSVRDRIRHAISFEIIGIALVVPLASMGFGIHAKDISVVVRGGRGNSDQLLRWIA